MSKNTEEKNIDLKGTEKKSAGENELTSDEMMVKFDEVLGANIERLLGTKTGIESLSMNLLNLSFIILLATRETEIESFPYLPPERYTNDKILNELTEISIDPGDDLELVTLDMAEKGYLEISDDGRFFAKKPAITIAQLIDQIFPNMPGLNLVAYWGQMIDEVHADRKDLELALSQFDQMLGMQGVTPKKQTNKVSPNDVSMSSAIIKKSSQNTVPKTPRAGSIKPANILSQLETSAKARDQEIFSKPHKEDTLQGDMTLKHSDENNFSDENNEAYSSEAPDKTDQGPVTPDTINDAHEEEQAEDAAAEEPLIEAVELKEKHADQSSYELDEAEDTQALTSMDSTDKDLSSDQNETDVPPGEGAHELDDIDIEKQILAFEQELGMKCPLCQTGDIKAEETAKGKKYFRCSNRSCNLISWGKPFFLACPHCKNPFLIEALRGDKTILKCPRATCHYWQKLPWESEDDSVKQTQAADNSSAVKKKPRKKIRRRRVVRRKR